MIEKKISAFVSKHNSNREKQVILLKIPDGEWWHYLAVRRITSKHCGDFYCLNHLDSFATENKYESRKKLLESNDFCNIIMLSRDNKILEFNLYQKYVKALFVIYADLECLIENIDEY